ncbi:MAG: TolC family protein [Gemmatirosa sp.]|nr:TolC family protein [Gemmatirosa sp.]
MRERILVSIVAMALGSRALAQPAAPTPPTDPASIVAFWTAAGDPALARLVDEALRANPDVRGAESRVVAARADRRTAMFELAPIVTTTGGITRSRPSDALVPPALGVRRDQTLFDAGFGASWEVDVFGRLRPLVAARTAAADAAVEDVRATRVSLAAEVARAYYERQGVARQLEVARRNAENQRHTLQLTVDRLDAGRGTALDRERAAAQLSATLAGVPTLEARAAAATYRLGVLLGRDETAAPLAPSVIDAPNDAPALPDLPPLDALPALVASRPDVRAADRVLAARGALVRSARADYLPRLGIAGSVGLASATADAFGRSGTSRYAIGPVVSWPAFDVGRVRARVDAARAEQEDARASYDRAVLAARAETRSAYAAAAGARARLAHLHDAARASERGAELARLRFEGGAAGFLEVLDAERTLLEAQDRLAQGETEAATAFAALYEALAGAWPAAAR